jgi:hypothetical protein
LADEPETKYLKSKEFFGTESFERERERISRKIVEKRGQLQTNYYANDYFTT